MVAKHNNNFIVYIIIIMLLVLDRNSYSTSVSLFQRTTCTGFIPDNVHVRLPGVYNNSLVAVDILRIRKLSIGCIMCIVGHIPKSLPFQCCKESKKTFACTNIYQPTIAGTAVTTERWL